MQIDRNLIGEDFHQLMLDMGEKYVLTKMDGEEYIGNLAMIAKTTSTYMLAERERLMSGTATFPDITAQTTFRGCYFYREANPEKTYIMVSTIPKDTTPLVADIYAIDCNTIVSLAYLVRTTDQRSNTIFVPEIYAEDVKVYMDSTVQKQKYSSDGNLDQTRIFIQIPARYGVTQDSIIIHKEPQFSTETKQVEIMETRYRVESIDVSMCQIIDDKIYGIFDVQLSLDTRG